MPSNERSQKGNNYVKQSAVDNSLKRERKMLLATLINRMIGSVFDNQRKGIIMFLFNEYNKEKISIRCMKILSGSEYIEDNEVKLFFSVIFMTAKHDINLKGEN